MNLSDLVEFDENLEFGRMGNRNLYAVENTWINPTIIGVFLSGTLYSNYFTRICSAKTPQKFFFSILYDLL